MVTLSLNKLTTELATAAEIEASLSQKLSESASAMMAVSGTPEFAYRQSLYFPILSKWRAAKRKLDELSSSARALKRNEQVNHSANDYARELEEKRAIKEQMVTSTTYEKAQKRLFEQVNGFVSGKRYA